MNIPLRRAVILAAGMGTRLSVGPRAPVAIPKPLRTVAGVPLLVRVLGTLRREGIDEVVIVLGHQGDAIRRALAAVPPLGVKLIFVENREYEKKNGVSLLAAAAWIDRPCLLLMADHLVAPEVIRRVRLAASPASKCVLGVDYQVDRCFDIDDATKVVVTRGKIEAIGKSLERYDAIDTGVFRVGPSLVEALRSVVERQGDASLSDGVQTLARRGDFVAVDVGDARWIDVDTPAAMERAEAMVRLFGEDFGGTPGQGSAPARPETIESFAPAWVRAAQPYREDHFERANSRAGVARMMSNENPFCPSPRVVQAVVDATLRGHLYPSSGRELRTKLGARDGMDADAVLLGAGSTELIDVLLRTFVAPGDEVLLSVPTFSMYEARARVCGGVPVLVPMTPEHDFDLPALLGAVSERTKLLFLCTPNNPTGNRLREEDLRRVLRLGIPTVVDEAYVEFSEGGTFAPLIREFPNAIILRTFSKALGLAGMRLGYTLAHPAITQLLQRVKVPWNIPGVTLAAAMAVLEDEQELSSRLTSLRQGRAHLTQALSGLPGVQVIPSEGNFLLLDVHQTGVPAEEILQAMFEQGVLVRSLAVHHADRGFLRITVGSEEENLRCVAAFEGALSRLRRRSSTSLRHGASPAAITAHSAE